MTGLQLHTITFSVRIAGAVLDLDMDNIETINHIAGKNFDGEIDTHNITFYGRCGDCVKNAKVLKM